MYEGAGSPGYAAPEQWTNLRDADARADVYALGRVLNFVLTMGGERSLAQRLDYCIRRCTAEEPIDRYQSVDALLLDLNLLLDEPHLLQRSEGAARELLQELLVRQNLSPEAVQPLALLLYDGRRDHRLLLRLFPRLGKPVYQVLLGSHLVIMRDVLAEYLLALAGPLAMDYALHATQVLEELSDATEDSYVRVQACIAVMKLASRYELSEAGYTVARMLANEPNPANLMMLHAFLVDNASILSWCTPYLRNVSLPPVLRKLLPD
jgi:hypothetical protein